MTLVSASRLLSLLLLTFSLFLSHHRCSAKCHVDDEAGLLTLKSGITQDPSGILATWKSGTDCCTWAGVSCNENNRVDTIRLNGNSDNPKESLSGKFPLSLSKLRFLNQIDFRNLQNITGSFPEFLFTLPSIKYIYIQNNRLSGPIPVDIASRLPPTLDTLDLSDNSLTGPIPNSIFRFTQLTQLGLRGNYLTGIIPKEIGQLRNLNFLGLQQNQLSGNIPDSVGLLRNLTNLNLGRNQLSGKIPDSLGSFYGIYVLTLSYNKLTGEIPSSISSLAPTLRFLELENNNLSGKIPDSFGKMQNLDTLDLSSNQLTGVVPSSFKNLTKIFTLNLARNKLVGPFPALNVEGIELLDLSYNKFNLGQIPKWVASSPIIYSLKLAGCGLKFRLEDFKPIETNFYEFIDLSNNQISGSPVRLLNQTTLLKEFSAASNLLKFNLSNLVIPQSLKLLDISRNQVFGKVPTSIDGLENIDLSHNHLCGQIPPTTKKFPAKSFVGNDCLCGTPLPACK